VHHASVASCLSTAAALSYSCIEATPSARVSTVIVYYRNHARLLSLCLTCGCPLQLQLCFIRVLMRLSATALYSHLCLHISVLHMSNANTANTVRVLCGTALQQHKTCSCACHLHSCVHLNSRGPLPHSCAQVVAGLHVWLPASAALLDYSVEKSYCCSLLYALTQ
jgi:hypothetical protein